MKFTSCEDAKNFFEKYKTEKKVTEGSVWAVLNNVLQYEMIYQKFLYQFTEDEIKAMYQAVGSLSVRSLQNRNLILEKFTDYILKKNKLSLKNIYGSICKADLYSCLNLEKKNSAILTRADLTEIQDNLLNYTDKAILEALFLGLGGYKLSELTFFDISHITDDQHFIRVNQKRISIDSNEFKMFHKACLETKLFPFGDTSQMYDVKTHGLFKERFNALSASNDPTKEDDKERRYRFIQRRLMGISKEFEMPITSGKIQESGLLHFLRIGIDQSGICFDKYIKTEEAHTLAKRYDINSDLYSQILKEKFAEYFQCV